MVSDFNRSNKFLKYTTTIKNDNYEYKYKRNEFL